MWTDHALQRLSERGITQGDAIVAFNHPDQSRKASTPGAWIYYKTVNGWKMEVVGKKNDRGEWVILSVWARQVFGGETKTIKKQNWFFEWVTRFLKQVFR